MFLHKQQASSCSQEPSSYFWLDPKVRKRSRAAALTREPAVKDDNRAAKLPSVCLKAATARLGRKLSLVTTGSPGSFRKPRKQPGQRARQSLARNQLIQGSDLSMVVSRPLGVSPADMFVQSTTPPKERANTARRDDPTVWWVDCWLGCWAAQPVPRANGLWPSFLAPFGQCQKELLASWHQEVQLAVAGDPA